MGVLLRGIPFFLIMVISLGVCLFLPYVLGMDGVLQEVSMSVAILLQLFIGCSMLFMVGLKDDLNGAGSLVKFVTLLMTALLLPGVGLTVDNLHGLFGIGQLPLAVSVPLTVLVVMYIVFAFSLLDGIDGLSGGFGCLILLAYFVLGIFCGSLVFQVIASVALGITLVLSLGALSGPRRPPVMMGNSGAYVLGYVVACLTVLLLHHPASPPGTALICVGILIVPMLDVLRVLGSRIRDGRDIEAPDRNQFNYKLLRTGLSPRWVPIVIALVMALFILVDVLAVWQQCDLTLLLVLNVALWIAMEYFLNWRIHDFEQAHHKAEWNKLYGREAWNSHIPHDVMRHKVETYGTMGLPVHMQNSNPIDFIPDGMTGLGRSAKRLWDLLLSTLCLVVFSPLFLLCYLLIKLDDGGPVIYRQERIGRFGRPFFIYKFRSMRLDAEKDGPALSHANGDEDPRLTRVGRFLRQHHLDELPQLWNVMTGDMAFIGYRPERKFFIDQIMLEDPRYAFLYQIRPGVTSYATLYNGYTDTMAKMLRRLELDLYYLRHRSWWFDCKVLFLTFASIVFGKKF